MNFTKIIRVLFILLLLPAMSAVTADWTRWRGPNGNGIVYDTDWDPLAISGNPKVVWETDLGLGYSSVAVKGDRLYAMGNSERITGADTVGLDIVYCFHSRTGREFWRFSYPCRTDNTWPGPTASPVLDGNRLYTLCDDTGDLYCLNALNGNVIWKRNVVSEFGTLPPYDGVGYAGSPYIEGDLVLFNLNTSGIALNKFTGNTVWASAPGRCSFSTPVVFNYGAEKRIALFGARNLFLLDVPTGKVQGSFLWETDCNENTADPIIHGDKIFISSAYGKGCALLRVMDGDPVLIWQNMELSNQFTSSVFIDGFVYGMDGERPRCSLRCIDIETGEVMWNQKMPFSSLIAADDKLIILDEDGMLRIVEAVPEAYREIASGLVQRTTGGKRPRGKKRTFWWSNPVISNGYLYVRSDKGDLVCLDMRN